MGSFHQDLNYAVRQLGKAPGFTVTAIVTIALGIGANTAIFSVVYALLLKSLPFYKAERLVSILETHPQATGGRGSNLSGFQRLAGPTEEF